MKDFFAAQDDPSQEGMLLFTDHGIFMEFMPVSEYGSPNPKTIGLQDVEIGQRYALVISTNSGLWRYLIGDTIEFVSLNPYRIHVAGRLKHYINAFGEEVIVDNTDKAIAAACVKTGATVVDYTAAPIYFDANANGAHECWLSLNNLLPHWNFLLPCWINPYKKLIVIMKQSVIGVLPYVNPWFVK